MGFEKNHVKSVHEGQKFQCPHCEHKATQRSHLQTHIKSVHEGQKFQCPHCEHKATEKGNLKKHIRSVHEGQKFTCKHCEYKASWRGDLQRHIKSIHEGRRSLKATKKNNLPNQIKSKQFSKSPVKKEYFKSEYFEEEDIKKEENEWWECWQLLLNFSLLIKFSNLVPLQKMKETLLSPAWRYKIRPHEPWLGQHQPPALEFWRWVPQL